MSDGDDFDLQAGGRGMTTLECVKAYPEGVVKALDMVREHVAALTAERDAAVARVAELEARRPVACPDCYGGEGGFCEPRSDGTLALVACETCGDSGGVWKVGP